VKHGNPSAPKPTELCGEANTNVPPVNQPAEETMTVQVFFGNSILDPEVLDCTKNFAVERTIPKTLAVARAALEELLKGPTEAEKAEGYFTSINPGVKIQSLTIENGVARVDFDEQLEFQVGGSCRAAAIA
jgi:spore germination protein GerM